MRESIEQAIRMKKEGEQLLLELGLIQLLKKYGDVHLTGSYEYGLMTRRDIDICVSVEHLSVDLLFFLGRDLARLPRIGAMYYRNELVLKTRGNPRAIFWCVEILDTRAYGWKLDILVSTFDEVTRVLEGANMLRELDNENCERIIEIKNVLTRTNEYGKTYRSTDIYEAVIQGDVKDLAGWEAWWRKKKQINMQKDNCG